MGDGPQPSPKGRIVPYPQNPDDIDLFEIMNSIEEERRRKNMQRFNQINNLDNSGLGGNSGESGDTKDGKQPKYGRREPPYLQRMKGRYSNDFCKMFEMFLPCHSRNLSALGLRVPLLRKSHKYGPSERGRAAEAAARDEDARRAVAVHLVQEVHRQLRRRLPPARHPDPQAGGKFVLPMARDVTKIL